MTGAPSLIAHPDGALPERYPAEAVRVLDEEERRRFLDTAGRPRHDEELAWELLYRIEPALYARLVAGERLHEGIIEWLPNRLGRVLEIGAGAGRLTFELARRCAHLTAIEPAQGLRRLLEERLRGSGTTNVDVLRGFFDALPAPEAAYDLVISCSAFAVRRMDEPDHCLRQMERRCTPGGLLALIWPSDVSWLQARGFEHVVFEGPMLVEYETPGDAVALARVFYPHALEAIAGQGSRFVDFATLGLNPPRDLCWKRVGRGRTHEGV